MAATTATQMRYDYACCEHCDHDSDPWTDHPDPCEHGCNDER